MVNRKLPMGAITMGMSFLNGGLCCPQVELCCRVSYLLLLLCILGWRALLWREGENWGVGRWCRQ